VLWRRAEEHIMSRILFDVGAQGQLVVDLQRSLQLRGFDPSPIDGVYDIDTAAAVRGCQASTSAPVTGGVADEQWTAITEGSPQAPRSARAT
jgi:peptidoglycan hydrolase-like protein with peptidoglycan-binding domain